MTVELPGLVAEYFEAANTNDADRITACFATDARVSDERQDFVGRQAIRQWAVEARRKYSFKSEPFVREGDDDAPVVRSHVTGNFPGSPVDLTYRFTLANGAITTLSIG